MANLFKLRKGLDINLQGKAELPGLCACLRVDSGHGGGDLVQQVEGTGSDEQSAVEEAAVYLRVPQQVVGVHRCVSIAAPTVQDLLHRDHCQRAGTHRDLATQPAQLPHVHRATEIQ